MPFLTALRQLFGRADPPDAAAQTVRAPVTRPREVQHATREQRSVVACEAMIGRHEEIVGYRFALNHAIEQRLQVHRDAALPAYEDALLRTLAGSELGALAAQQQVSVALSPAALDHPELAHLPRQNVQLILGAATTGASEIGAWVAQAHALGFAVGVPWNGVDGLLANGALLDCLEVDAAAYNGMQLRHLAGELRAYRALGRKPLILAVRGVQDDEEYRFCRQAGFDRCSGPFTERRSGWRPPASEVNRLLVIDVLNQIRGGAEIKVIAAALKPEPVLTFKLLRHINSVGLGLQHQVDSVAQALIVLGRSRVYRWLSLLLYDFGAPGYRERVLTRQALGRGRLLELLAGQGNVPAQPDALFTLGLFSLLDVLFAQPIAVLLQSIDLPAPVAQALQGQDGALHDALALALAVEAGEAEAIEDGCRLCGIDALQLDTARIDALAWCQQVGSPEPAKAG